MRLIKLNKEVEFPEEKDLQEYFKVKLLTRDSQGLFLLPKGWIAEKSLKPGETLLFSYRGKLRFVAKALTGRLNNTYELQHRYPYCFVIEMGSLRETNIPLSELEQLFKEIHLRKSLSKGEGWVKIPDSDQTEEIVNKLIS